MRRLACLSAVLGALLVGAPPAGAATERVSSEGITATFTYHGRYPNYTGLHLRIARGSAVLYDAAVHDPFCGSLCWPGQLATRSSVHIAPLEQAGTPDVVLDLFSGGAHCCGIEQIFTPAHSGRYARTGDHNFWDAGATIKDLGHDGRREFLSADSHFAYEFTDYAASGLPVQIWTFSGGHFHDATASYPHLIAHDAAVWLRAFKRQAQLHYIDSVGVIAAWAADEDRLGKHAAVDRYLDAQARAGHLNGAVVSGRHFVAALHRFLHRLGYL